MPKAKPRRQNASKRHNPLHVDILENQVCGDISRVIKASVKELSTGKSNNINNFVDISEANEDETQVPIALGKRLLTLAEAQRQDEFPDELENVDEAPDVAVDSSGYVVLDEEDEKEDELFMKKSNLLCISPGVTKTLKFAASDKSVNLADLIVKQLEQNQASESPGSNLQNHQYSQISNVALSPVVVQVYSAMAPFLQKYRSGKIPKAFKILPRLKAWEEILMLTEPISWSPQAMCEATKIFCSNLKEQMCERFLNMVLLPAVREDIHANKKLNYHLYMALKRALFKPGAFFKGIYLPLALEGGCTVRESIIVGSVVSKVSIPVLHGAASLCHLAMIDKDSWSPPIGHLIRVLIDKKYALPQRAIDICIEHFTKFVDTPEALPLSWHRCLLCFVQRYKFHMNDSVRASIRRLVAVQDHGDITLEIRKELNMQIPAHVLETRQKALVSAHQQSLQQHQQQFCEMPVG